jgi:hypothetical protein
MSREGLLNTLRGATGTARKNLPLDGTIHPIRQISYLNFHLVLWSLLVGRKLAARRDVKYCPVAVSRSDRSMPDFRFRTPERPLWRVSHLLLQVDKLTSIHLYRKVVGRLTITMQLQLSDNH